MILKPFTGICLLAAAGSGLYLYQTKHHAQVLERSIARTMKAADAVRLRAGLMRAEYALLNDPSRLAELSEQLLPGLKTTAPGQFAALADFEKRLPPVGVPAAPAVEPLEPQAPDAVLPKAPRPEQVKVETPRAEPAKPEPAKSEPTRIEPQKTDPARAPLMVNRAPATFAPSLPSFVASAQAAPRPTVLAVAAPPPAVAPVVAAPVAAAPVIATPLPPPTRMSAPPASAQPARTAAAAPRAVTAQPLGVPAPVPLATPVAARVPARPAYVPPAYAQSAYAQPGYARPAAPAFASALGMARTMPSAAPLVTPAQGYGQR